VQALVVFQFPDLDRIANRRIANAIETAFDALLDDVAAACRRFSTVQQQAKAGKGTRDECRKAFAALMRTVNEAFVTAACSIFDVAAIEYRNAASDHQIYINRLHQRVLLEVYASLPFPEIESSLSRVLRTRIGYWESQTPPAERVA
jgi:hypothetical protein